MSERNRCPDCGGTKSRKSTRCRSCHLTTFDLRKARPQQLGPARVPEVLHTGSQLLDRIWWRRERVQRG